MPKFNLSNLNPGTWMDLSIGGRVCLCVCSGDDLREIRKQCVKKKVEYRGVNRFVYEEIDEEKQSEAIWDFCIRDWEEICDQEGKAIPCTREMKVLLMGKSPEFARAVGEGLQTLTKVEADRVEEAGKN